MSAYLQCVGLPADQAEAHAKSLLVQVEGQPGAADQDIAALALTEVMSQYEEWLDYLRRQADKDGGGGGGLLAWRLREVLAADPSMFLRRGELPESLRSAVRESAQPPVPEAVPAPMPAQTFGEVLPAFQAGFWRRVGRRLASLTRGLGRWM